MTIDDIYRACTAAYGTSESNAYRLRAQARELAGILVAVLPVARAAEALATIDAPGEMSPMANAYRVIEHGRREAALIKAVEAMREHLAKMPEEA